MTLNIVGDPARPSGRQCLFTLSRKLTGVALYTVQNCSRWHSLFAKQEVRQRRGRSSFRKQRNHVERSHRSPTVFKAPTIRGSASARKAQSILVIRMAMG